jgi:hypothetical protein
VAHCKLVFLTTFGMFFLQVGMYSDVGTHETLTLMHALRPPIVLENVLNDLVHLTFEHYKSVSPHNEYETTYGRECLKTKRQYQSILAKRFKEYDERSAAKKNKCFGIGTHYTIYVPRTHKSSISCHHCPRVILQTRRTRFAVSCLEIGRLP